MRSLLLVKKPSFQEKTLFLAPIILYMRKVVNPKIGRTIGWRLAEIEVI